MQPGEFIARHGAQQYPDGHFKELAQARLGQLKREKKGEGG
jgi:hypothetical protein